jgi:SanA protein
MVKRLWQTLFFVVIIFVISVLAIDVLIDDSSKNRLYDLVENVPKRGVAIVLGTAKYVRKGKINYYYQYRIDAAVKLYKSGKVKAILVSGDNATPYYNEPARMKRDLIKQGVPKSKIYLDFAGFRTLDSILRAKEIFGIKTDSYTHRTLPTIYSV